MGKRLPGCWESFYFLWMKERKQGRRKAQIPHLNITVTITFKYILITTVFHEEQRLLFVQHIYHKQLWESLFIQVCVRKVFFFSFKYTRMMTENGVKSNIISLHKLIRKAYLNINWVWIEQIKPFSAEKKSQQSLHFRMTGNSKLCLYKANRWGLFSFYYF